MLRKYLCVIFCFLSFAFAQTTKKVLIIGIDGTRPDALQVAKTPNIDKLIASGVVSYKAQTGDITYSGPGWSSMLTGVWLILISTDHGGVGTSHGKNLPKIRTIFLIVSGKSAKQGKFLGPVFIVDVVATVLAHLGVAINPTWKLDGRVAGIK